MNCVVISCLWAGRLSCVCPDAVFNTREDSCHLSFISYSVICIVMLWLMTLQVLFCLQCYLYFDVVADVNTSCLFCLQCNCSVMLWMSAQVVFFCLQCYLFCDVVSDVNTSCLFCLQCYLFHGVADINTRKDSAATCHVCYNVICAMMWLMSAQEKTVL